jgi:CheY-like chemotaxis protein
LLGKKMPALCSKIGYETASSQRSRDTKETSTETATPKTLPLKKRRVLLAEDNVVNQKVICAMLRKLGAEITVAHNGEEALSALTSGLEPELILMDCQMPVMDGFAATRAMRGLADDAAEVPIVAITANTMSGDRELCLQAGMDDYLAKPITRDALEQVLLLCCLI